MPGLEQDVSFPLDRARGPLIGGAMCLKKTGSHMSTSSTSGIHVGIHGEQLPNALQRHYLLFATLASRGDYIPGRPWHAPASTHPFLFTYTASDVA